MTNTEAPFNLEQTVTKWNQAIGSDAPFTGSEVENLAIDTIHLAAHLYHIPVEELRDGEEIAWEDQIGFIGLNTDGSPWISMKYSYGDIRALVEHGSDPKELATLVWKGALLKHRTAKDLLPYQDTIHALLGLPTE